MLYVDQLFDGEFLLRAGGLCRGAARACQENDYDTNCVNPIAHWAPSRALKKYAFRETSPAGGAKVSPNPPSREERFQVKYNCFGQNVKRRPKRVTNGLMVL